MSTKTKGKSRPATVSARPAPVSKTIKKSPDYQLILMWVMVLFFSILRIRLLDIPLERDEGEYAYMGRLILDGIAPYQHAYNMKLPGTYFMYALVMGIFGETIQGIHIGLLISNAATMAVLFFAFRKIFNSSIALFAASVYGLMSLSPAFMGFAAHATQFVTLFAAGGLLTLAHFMQKGKPIMAFLTGILFGLSFLMKQQAVFFLLFGGIMVLAHYFTVKPLRFLPMVKQGFIYTLGGILPYALTALALKMAGAFDKFWFWTVEYAGKYAAGLSFKDGKATFNESFQPMWQEFKIFWLLFLAGLVLLFLSRFTVRQKLTALLFTIFAFLTVVPGFYFRQHYFIPFLPAVGLCGGIALHYLATQASALFNSRFPAYLPFAVFVIALFVILPQKKEYYLSPDAELISKNIYGSNPFLESPVIAEYIKENSSPEDRIAVLGSEPQICFYADRYSASGHIYTYGLMEDHAYNKTMQQEMISEIEKAKPKFLVICNIGTSWLRRENSPSLIFDWSQTYAQKHYDMVGITDIVSNTETNYKWGAELQTYQPKSENLIYIFKRKP